MIGAFKLYSGSGSIWDEGLFQIYNKSTTTARFKSASTAPISKYKSLSITYELETSELRWDSMIQIVSSSEYIYENNGSNAVGKYATMEYDFIQSTDDSQIDLVIKADTDGTAVRIYIKELYLY